MTLAQKMLPVLLGGPLTRDALSDAIGHDIPSSYVTALLQEDLVKARSVVRTGKRGRPAYVLGLTDKGRKRAKRLA